MEEIKKEISDTELEEVSGGTRDDFSRIYTYCLLKHLGNQDPRFTKEEYVGDVIKSLFPDCTCNFRVKHMEDRDDVYTLTSINLVTGEKKSIQYNTDEIMEMLISKYGE